MKNFWRNVAVVPLGDQWQASAEYVCVSEGGTVYRIKSNFSTKAKAEYFVSAIR